LRAARFARDWAPGTPSKALERRGTLGRRKEFPIPGAARQLGFTRARITQIVGRLQLAPDLQEHVLDLVAVDGVEPLSEGALREVVRHTQWDQQRAAWRLLSP